MRYIDPEKVKANLLNGWEEKALNALEEVKSLSAQERSKAINNKGDIWKDLKGILKDASYGKCWYCESRQERSDNAVDHYRPKNRVAESTDHEGYWWLAFKWTNYRYSCTFCNSRRIDQDHGTEGGKHDHFPLLDEEKRAFTEHDDVDAEQPLLLDPVCRDDPAHIWYDEDGQARPNPRLCSDESSYPYKRAQTSIKLYHLNHVDTIEGRKVLCQFIRKSVEQANGFYDKYSKGDMTAKASFRNTVSDLHDSLRGNAEYSAAARSTLMGLRGKSAIAEMVLAEA